MSDTDLIIDTIRNRRTQIPAIPSVVQQILALAGDEDTSAADLSAVIKKDQALANKTLRLANSAYFGLPKQVDSISRAITLIGFNEITSMIIGMSVLSAFGAGNGSALISSRDLWMHAMATGVAADAVARRIDVANKGAVQLCGLMHDIGKVFLLAYFAKDYEKVLAHAGRHQQPLYHSETALLGITHDEVAGLLMDQWNFPDALVVPCQFHHRIDTCPPAHRIHAAIVALADYVCLQAGVGQSGNPVIENRVHLIPALQLSEHDMDGITAELERRRSEIDKFVDFIK